jgi:hypothetical protein
MQIQGLTFSWLNRGPHDNKFTASYLAVCGAVLNIPTIGEPKILSFLCQLLKDGQKHSEQNSSLFCISKSYTQQYT